MTMYGGKRPAAWNGRSVAASVLRRRRTTTLGEDSDQIKARPPGAGALRRRIRGPARRVPLNSLASASFVRQVGTAPRSRPHRYPWRAPRVPPRRWTLRLWELHVAELSGAGEYIPQIGTRSGTPAAHGSNTIHFNLVLPSGTCPAAGWPGGDLRPWFHRQPLPGAPLSLPRAWRTRHRAIAINVVGARRRAARDHRGDHHFRRDPSPCRPAAGIDQNGDGVSPLLEGSLRRTPHADRQRRRAAPTTAT